MITTAPSVIYKVNTTKGDVLSIDNPSNLPSVDRIVSIEEPVVKATILVPSEYVGVIMELNQEKRGTYSNMDYVSKSRVKLIYELPLSEIVFDYFDQLKSRTKGYASLDYELSGYKQTELVKIDILLNGELVDALSFIVHKAKAYHRGRKLVEKLRGIIPRHMFEIPIQSVIGNKVIARETVSAMRKDVLSKCYGGDISRKRKLLEKQKAGKKRMKQVGSVEIPQNAFMAVLQIED